MYTTAEDILWHTPIYNIAKESISSTYRILMTGVTSIHGWPVFKRLREIHPENCLFGIRPPKMKVPIGENVIAGCVSDKALLEYVKERFHPTHVIHAAGVCDLDVCESCPEWAYQINAIGSQNIMEVFSDTAYILYLSADLVFSGHNPPLGGYTELNVPNPVSMVGKTFAAGERFLEQARHFAIIRLGLPIGASILDNKGGVDWIAGRMRRGKPVTLFYDEFRSCLRCDEIPNIVLRFLRYEQTGIFHMGGMTPISLWQLGKMVNEAGNFEPTLLRGISHFEDIDGPPRMGDVSLNSSKLAHFLETTN